MTENFCMMKNDNKFIIRIFLNYHIEAKQAPLVLESVEYEHFLFLK